MPTLELSPPSTSRAGGDAPLIGATLGQYEIAARIGGGGMGVVYKARDRRLDRWVALKLAAPQFGRDDIAQHRLLVEAQVASALNHRNVCTVHGIEATNDGQLFMVMAYYEGKSLKQRLEDGPIHLLDVLRIAGEVADGLAHIHAKGIVHCDIKPSNLLVAEDGIKILDFGLAQSGQTQSLALSSSTNPCTLAYAAPEQARGDQVDARTDIWAVGVALFEMLTARVPFNGAYPEAVSYSIRHDPTPPLGLPASNVPPALERLVFKALDKDPSRRFQTAEELAVELRRMETSLRQNGRWSPSEIDQSGLIGKRVSRYCITRRIGIGGMGVVYEAKDTQLPRLVALKFVSDDFMHDADAMRRLKREAETIARLNHPHICSVYETTEHEGRGCIVMERLEGMNLKQYMLKRMLETSEIVDIVIQIAEALGAAHEVGIVHRDIKPGNIFIGKSGFVKVLDFGLARRFGGQGAGAPAEGSSIPGRPVGTINYMAPERILQMAIDARTDLFSLGVVMYEMATERLPFATSSPAETVTNVLENDPVPLRKLAPDRPVALERIVSKLLAKQPAGRYHSAAALRRALVALWSNRASDDTVSMTHVSRSSIACRTLTKKGAPGRTVDHKSQAHAC